MRKLSLALSLSLTFSILTPVLSVAASKEREFVAEVWADNWFALYVNGKKIGEDSIPITVERSFNSESISFSAKYPFQVGVLARDFTENRTGLEYIGTARQQIGDGGIIFQIRDKKSGLIVAASDTTWRALVIDKAPLNPDCVSSAQPLVDCKFHSIPIPKGWSQSRFDVTRWSRANIYSETEVGVKDGYFDFEWNDKAKLIWSSDLKLDNTILLVKTIKN